MRQLELDGQERAIRIATGLHAIEGNLVIPPRAIGIVLFAHGSGSSRFSPRNRAVAERLNRAALGTLLIDLLTEDEEALDAFTAELRFDIPFLAGRLLSAADWLRGEPSSARLPIGYFGASTGAAAALVAAARRPKIVKAVVSRGGRPDLAEGALGSVEAPTLLIVGSEDREVLALNQRALLGLYAPARLSIIPGATHLFEEAGALEKVAGLARDWFLEHLAAAIR
jgi:putative phosphoribosyl transferase